MSDGSVDNNQEHLDPAEQALDALHAGWDGQGDTAELDAEAREYLEVLVLLASDVDDIEPSPAVKAGLFDRLESAAESASGQVVAFPRPERPATASRQPSWLVPALAAGLALCLLSLGYFYGQLTSLHGQLSDASDRLAVQAGQLEDSELLQVRLIETQREVADLHERLAMVDTVAQQAYPLRPASFDGSGAAGSGATRDQPLPDGRVYVCGQHQRWYLTAQHLEPAPEGQEYHLWFMTENGAVDAGVVEVSGGSALLRNLSMPTGTHGFAITLEDAGMEGDEPLGPMILRGDEPVRL